MYLPIHLRAHMALLGGEVNEPHAPQIEVPRHPKSNSLEPKRLHVGLGHHKILMVPSPGALCTLLLVLSLGKFLPLRVSVSVHCCFRNATKDAEHGSCFTGRWVGSTGRQLRFCGRVSPSIGGN